MSIIDHHPLNKALADVLNHASPVPEMPAVRIEASAMAAFSAQIAPRHAWVKTFGALAASLVLGVGGFVYYQSWQNEQKALTADADAFAEQLLSTDIDSAL
ncbi:MAG: hypothetical protein ACK5XZ_05430 [Hyphomonadaceae bacterium]|jgi:hypothetical protein